MKEELEVWLKTQQNIIDTIIATTADKYFTDHKEEINFLYDLKECHKESYNLINGKDLCYDRPNTAFAYSLWYHPRRINTFLSFFTDKIINQNESHLEVFDLGAGVGAIQWSLGLIYCGLRRLGKVPPKITLINIDTSPFMLHYNRDYLWKEFLVFYPEIDENFKIIYEVNSWNNKSNITTTNAIIAASYLFDASDNKKEIADDFTKIVNLYKPKSVLLLTSNQQEKRSFLTELESDLKNIGYSSLLGTSHELLFNEPLIKINFLRNKLAVALNISELKRSCTWFDRSHSSLILQNTKPEISFFTQSTINELSIFNPPIVLRKDVILNDFQKRAAKNTNRPSAIYGPAGCGKSIVITEKIKNLIEKHEYNPELKILVTTFNKGLIKKLSEWINELLDPSKISLTYDIDKSGYEEKSSHFKIVNSKITNIRLLHFDKLPQKLGYVQYYGMVKIEDHYNILDKIILDVKESESITTKHFDSILNHTFLYEEYHRVIYGLQVGIKNGKERYQTIERTGRGGNPKMAKNSDWRNYSWLCLEIYAKYIFNNKIPSFTLRRQLFYNFLKDEIYKNKYDYILIDEFQDCTRADFEVFYALIKSPNNLTIAGDLAQSIQLGKTARIPRDDNMLNIRKSVLQGSYRLPVRISEAILNLSNEIVTKYRNTDGVSSIKPYKCSPPGARPIMVYGNDNASLALKVSAIYNTYNIYEINKITILEKDSEFKKSLESLGIPCETDSVLSLKGLEKQCIVWSTRVPLEFEKEFLEFSYTILTRTACILIIVLTNDTQKVYKEVLWLLEKTRLIMWDEESEDMYNTLCQEYMPDLIEEDE